MQDTGKFLTSLLEVWKYDGVIVPGLRNRVGRRNQERAQDTQGGARIKGLEVAKQSWIHPDAIPSRRIVWMSPFKYTIL